MLCSLVNSLNILYTSCKLLTAEVTAQANWTNGFLEILSSTCKLLRDQQNSAHTYCKQVGERSKDSGHKSFFFFLMTDDSTFFFFPPNLVLLPALLKTNCIDSPRTESSCIYSISHLRLLKKKKIPLHYHEVIFWSETPSALSVSSLIEKCTLSRTAPTCRKLKNCLKH